MKKTSLLFSACLAAGLAHGQGIHTTARQNNEAGSKSELRPNATSSVMEQTKAFKTTPDQVENAGMIMLMPY